jgi:transposase-like protein
MYCRKCLKESKEKQKINMGIDTINQRYVCPECGYVLEWENAVVNYEGIENY